MNEFSDPIPLEILAFEHYFWKHPGAKDWAIRKQLGISPTRYYQLLNALLDDPEMLRKDPVTINRLRRQREQARARR